jgi:hypothetical protein
MTTTAATMTMKSVMSMPVPMNPLSLDADEESTGALVVGALVVGETVVGAGVVGAFVVGAYVVGEWLTWPATVGGMLTN